MRRAPVRRVPAVVLVLAAVCAAAGCTTVTAPPRPLPRRAPSSDAARVHDAPDGSTPVPPPAHQVLDTVGPRPVGRHAPVPPHRIRDDDRTSTGRLPAPRRSTAPRPLPRVPPLPALRGLPQPADVCALGLRYAAQGRTGPQGAGLASAGRAAGSAAARVCAHATALP